MNLCIAQRQTLRIRCLSYKQERIQEVSIRYSDYSPCLTAESNRLVGMYSPFFVALIHHHVIVTFGQVKGFRSIVYA